jgi:hypothetical protein
VGTQVQGLERGLEVQETVLSTADVADRERRPASTSTRRCRRWLLFQRSYQASARVISTVDSVLETLINLGR